MFLYILLCLQNIGKIIKYYLKASKIYKNFLFKELIANINYNYQYTCG